MTTVGEAGKNNFDSLRLIFATLVVFSHSYPILRGNNATEPLSVITNGVMTFGEVSVWAFFIISGFLITQSWRRSPSLARFLRRRIFRIYPGFIVATAVCAFILYPFAVDPSDHRHITVSNYFFHVLRLQMFDEGQPFHHNPLTDVMNGSLWSIPFEFWCYIGVAGLGITLLLCHRYLIMALLMSVMGFHLFIEVFQLRPGGKILGRIFGYPVFWSIVLPFFLSGMLLELFGKDIKLRTRYAALALLTLAISIFVPHATVFTAPICGSYLIMWLAYLPLLHGLNLGRWGDFSYGTYLYAFPIQQLLALYLRPRLTPLALFAISAPFSLLAGVLSWHLVEKRFLRRTAVKRLEERPLEDVRQNLKAVPVETRDRLAVEVLGRRARRSQHAEEGTQRGADHCGT